MAMMATISLIQQDLGGKLDWIDPTHYRCGSGQLPWEEIRAIAPVVNIRVLEGAEIPSFIYSSKGGKDGFPKVRVFDESGGGNQINIPTKSWSSFEEFDMGEGSERGSIAPSFTPQRVVGECALDPSAPPLFNPESPEDEFALENEELYRAYFGRGTNVIILKEGRLEREEESCVLVNAANKGLYHGGGVAAALSETAGPRFQAESEKILQRRKSPIKPGDASLQKLGGPNGKPVIHAIGHERGQKVDMAEELTAIVTLDSLIDNICQLARENNYRVIAMPIISGGIFGFDDIKMGAALVNALVRKTKTVDWPKMWMICHPDVRILEAITATVNQDETAGEGGSNQGAAAGPVNVSEVREEPCPEWPILRRTGTSKGKKDAVENPFPKLKHGNTFETFKLGKGVYRPTHANARKRETNLDRHDEWDREYAPGITCGQVWGLLNGGDATEILADTSLTQRAKRAILAQKDLVSKAALEKLIRNAVGSAVFEEYYSDPGPESGDSESEPDSADEGDSEYEELRMERPPRRGTPVIERAAPKPRRLRFETPAPELEYVPEVEADRPREYTELNRHLEALHLGTPGQKRPSLLFGQVSSPRQNEARVSVSNTTLEELMKREHEIKLLREVRLKNTTVKGKVRELVRYGERMKVSGESIDSHILSEFGLQGGIKLARTLEGLVPTNQEDLEQEQFEVKWRSIGALAACQDMAVKGVEGILRHIFQGVKNNALQGAREFLLYGPETSPEELEKALIRFDRKSEIINTDKDKSHNRPPQYKDQPRKSGRERKPYNRYEMERRHSPRHDRKTDHRANKGEERTPRDRSRPPPRGGKGFRNQSRPRTERTEGSRGKSDFISPEKWEKLSAEERARIVSERGRNRSETRVGRVRLDNHPDHEKGRVEETRVKPKRGRKKATVSADA